MNRRKKIKLAKLIISSTRIYKNTVNIFLNLFMEARYILYETPSKRLKRKTAFGTVPYGQKVKFGQKNKAPASRKPVWKGVISIGLLSVPIKLYPMVRDRSVKFRFLHRTDNQPLRYERICSKDEQVVPWADVVKGYELNPGRYVVFSQEEIDAVKPESDKHVKIDKFIDYFSVDPVYFYKNYVILPDNSEDAYSLLLMALSQTGKAGAGRITLREKEYPSLIHAYKDALVLTTMRYAYDVVDPSSFEELNQLGFPERSELNLAKKIITELSGDFDLASYEDTYRLKIDELVQKKLNGESIRVEKEPLNEEIKDLTIALRKTLKQLQNR